MAELLGARVFHYVFEEYAGSFAWSMLLPMTPGLSGDYGVVNDPKGPYLGCVLGTRYVASDDKVLRIRPTGENDSGPYFNSVLSGHNGVTGAGNFLWREPQGSSVVERAILTCNFRNTGYHKNGMHTYHYYSRFISDGNTAVAYGIIVSDKKPIGSCFIRGITCHRYSGSWSLNKRVYLRAWDYSIRTGIPDASFAFYQEKLDYLGWSILTGARSGLGIDPELTERKVSTYVVRGQPISVVYGDLSFEKGELTAFEWWDITHALEGRYRALAGQAYYNACSNLPSATTNSIATVLEAASSLSEAFKGNFGALVPSSAKDAWLFYRYQYTTSKLDVEEYIDATKRLAALAAMPGIRSDGTATCDGISCHVTIRVDPSAIIPNNVKEWLRSYGFELSWLNVWDMIPYSFVVDWFFHVGSFLEVMEKESWAYTLPIMEAWTSFTTFGPGAQRTYFRVPGYFRANCPFLDYTQRGPSGKTIIKRFLDSIALFT